MDALAAKNAAERAPTAAPGNEEPKLMAGPPELKPLSRTAINLKMTNDSRVIFDTVAKLAGLTVVFDPDFTSRRIAAELTNVTLEQALDIVSLESKAFWKPVTNDIIFVAPDQAQKRRDYEEEIVRTIYLKNTMLPQDLTEIVNGLRQLLDLRRVQQFNAQNAIIVRDTPDKVMLAEKIVNDIDKPKAEVVVQFSVLQARRDRVQDLGINPGTSVGNIASVTFTPPGTTTTTPSTTGTTTTPTTTAGIPLNQLHSIGTGDYSITLPSATATALLTDSQTRIIDDPQIRMVDGQEAKLRIGERVPVATGSFQAGVGVGTTGTAGLVNPLVNTQFQYLDVGVIVDVTPRIHPEDHEVSLKLSIEVSSVTGTQSIGGINQPVISTKKIEHDVRLQDGEVNILGGLIEKSNTHNRGRLAGALADSLPEIFHLRNGYRKRGRGRPDRRDAAHHSHSEYHGGKSAQHRFGLGYESRDSAGIRGHVAAPSSSGWSQRGNPRSARWGARTRYSTGHSSTRGTQLLERQLLKLNRPQWANWASSLLRLPSRWAKRPPSASP